VVDRAIAEFEPRPPARASRRHIPDTVLDGWSNDSFTVRLASVRGYSHRWEGTPRQDNVEAFHFRLRMQGETYDAVLFAVADGVSNAERGELGATTATKAGLDALWAMLEADGSVSWREVIDSVVFRMTEMTSRHLGLAEPTPEQVGGLLATTLVIGAVAALPTANRVLMARVGDSGAWVFDKATFRPVFAPKADPDNPVVSSAVAALPRIPSRLPTTTFDLAPHEVLLVGTDGFGDPLGDGTGQVGQLFAGQLATPPPARGLAHLLDFSRETFDDDRTLLAIWPRAGDTTPRGVR